MAAIKEIKQRLDELMPQLRVLLLKDKLTHKEDIERERYIEEIYKLLVEYAKKKNWDMQIPDPNYVDNVIIFQVMKYSIDTYLKSGEKTFFNLFASNYKMKEPDIKRGHLNLTKHDNNVGVQHALYEYFKAITKKHEVDQEGINPELVKYIKRLNYEQLKKYAMSIGCTQEEVDELEAIYSTVYASSDDNKIELEEDDKYSTDSWSKYPLINDVLDVTYKESHKEGDKIAKYVSGYWTIRFIEERIGKKQAQFWEIYIILFFFLANEQLFDKHGELMDLMAQEFDLKRRAWNNHYKEAFDNICRYVRKIYILK